MRKPICLSIIFTGFLILVGAQLTAAQKIPIPLAQQLVKDDQYVKEKMQERHWTIAQLAGQINDVKKVDLNGDGSPEFIFSGIVCGNANCSTWIYRKDGSRYVQIPFDASAVGIEISKTPTKGYLDIIVEGHSSAAETELHVYKFDGSKYEVKECFSKKFAVVNPRTGKATVLKTPKITKIKCGS